MPVEDWIEKWTEMCTREMDTMSKNHTEQINRIEKQYGDRMDKLETSIDDLDKKLETKIENINTKIDNLSTRMDTKIDNITTLIKEINEKSKERDNEQTVHYTILNTKFVAYASIGAVIGAAALTAFFEWVVPVISK